MVKDYQPMKIRGTDCFIYCSKRTTPDRYYLQVYLGEAVTNTTQAWKVIQEIIKNQHG